MVFLSILAKSYLIPDDSGRANPLFLEKFVVFIPGISHEFSRILYNIFSIVLIGSLCRIKPQSKDVIINELHFEGSFLPIDFENHF